MSRHPEVKWAQRIDKVYITVQLPDAKDVTVNLEPEGVLNFSATAASQDYELKLELHDKVNVEESKINTGVRSIFCVVQKAEKVWWKKLLRAEGKAPHFVKVDWDKWVDEDDDGTDPDLGGMDFSKFGGMDGGMGMGGMDSMMGGMGMGGMGGMGMGGMGMGGMSGMGMGGMGGMGMGGMGGMGMGGMGGMGMDGMGDDLDDDEDEDEEVGKPGGAVVEEAVHKPDVSAAKEDKSDPPAEK